MCQARVILRRGEQEEELMKDVVALEIGEDEILLRAFFEEPKRVKARLKEIDFLKHRVVLEEAR